MNTDFYAVAMELEAFARGMHKGTYTRQCQLTEILIAVRSGDDEAKRDEFDGWETHFIEMPQADFAELWHNR